MPDPAHASSDTGNWLPLVLASRGCVAVPRIVQAIKCRRSLPAGFVSFSPSSFDVIDALRAWLRALDCDHHLRAKDWDLRPSLIAEQRTSPNLQRATQVLDRYFLRLTRPCSSRTTYKCCYFRRLCCQLLQISQHPLYKLEVVDTIEILFIDSFDRRTLPAYPTPLPIGRVLQKLLKSTQGPAAVTR